MLVIISEDGPITTAELAEQLDVTDTAVRRHVDNLVEAGLIESIRLPLRRRRGRGRPAKEWVISDAGHRALQSDYDTLARSALHFLEETAGVAAITAFAEARATTMEKRYAGAVAAAGDSLGDRTKALVDALTDDGYSASARPVDDPDLPEGYIGIQLCQGHCPIQDAATDYPQFCEAETEAFSRLLGVHVQRLATLAQGDRVCTTFIPTTAINEGSTR